MLGTRVALLRGINIGRKYPLPTKAREEVVEGAAVAWQQ